METKTKQRVIGGVVLVAVLAIFLPLLFHNSRPSAGLKISQHVPKPPASPDIQLQLPLNNSPSVTQPPSEKATVQQTPAVTRKILNIVPPKVMKTEKPLAMKKKPAVVKHKKSNKERAPAVKKQEAKSGSTASLSSFALSAPKAWVIQAGSFSDQQNADRLVKQLRAKGLDVYTRKRVSGGKAITRVYVGPEINLSKTKEMQQQLKKQFKLTGVIEKYTS